MKHARERGFTLIELLIVITIIGILAVTGLSLLNPVEMMRRTWDNSSKTTARQILDGAIQAYLNDQTRYTKVDTSGYVTAANLMALIDELVDRSNLKSSVEQGKLYSGLEDGTAYVDADYYFDYDEDLYFVCFNPMSSAEKENAKCYANAGVNLFDADYVPADPVNGDCEAVDDTLLLCIQ